MDIILYGAGEQGKVILEKIKRYKDVNIIGFFDTFKTGTHEGLPILNMVENSTKYENTPIVLSSIAGFAQTRKEIYYRLKELGFKHIYYHWNKTFCNGDDFLRDECIGLNPKGDNILFYAEMSIIDSCNLNCKGCNHYAAIFPKRVPDFDARIKDILKLREIYDDVIEFGLIGGEPLLNPDTDLYIKRIKKILPNTKLQMVTNGLLIPTIPEKILQTIRNYGVLLVISEYIPTSKIMDKIEERLRKFKIDYEIRAVDIKKKFYKTLSLTKDSRYPKKCISRGCTNIWEGKIARCPTVLYIEELNRKFGTQFPSEGIYNLSDYTDGKSLNEDLSKKLPLCDYCIEYVFDWEQCGQKVNLEDFVVFE